MVQSPQFPFEFLHADTKTQARRGRLHLPHGVVETPAFMPVGTQGTVKGLTIDQVAGTGAQILLGNTYHLALRPGSELIAELGGLHRFMGWDRPILTDSGGFQIFSLGEMNKVTEDGATFKSHLDGSKIHLRPEDSIRIQEQLGSDIAMVLDHVIALPASDEAVLDASDRSVRWAQRCKDAAVRQDQAMFAIVQGGLNPNARVRCAEQLMEVGFDGYAVGGLSVGEPPPEMYRILDIVCPVLPTDQPRYLMGVGRPIDLVEGIARGIDMFDCVMPTRNARHGYLFTHQGILHAKSRKWEFDLSAVDSLSSNPLIQSTSKSYLRHLFKCEELLAMQIASINNLSFYLDLVREARAHILAGDYKSWKEEKIRAVMCKL